MQKKITVVIVVLIIIVAAVLLIVQRRQGVSNVASVVQFDNQNQSDVSPDVSDSHNFILDLEQNNSTTTMMVGDELLIQLGTEEWKTYLSTKDIITPIPNMPEIAGVQGIYKGAQPGTVVVEADSPTTSFKATVIVE